MSPAPQWLTYLGLVVVAAPFLLTVMLGISSMLGRRPGERTMVRWVQAAVISGLLAAVVVLIAMLVLGTRHVAIDLGNWVAIPRHYHFSVKFVFDRLSVPMAILSFMLSGTIGAFASKYLHRERGFHRFFVLYAMFLLGMVVASLAGTIETLFTGWELVGLSSALLVAYFQERPAPARNGLWVWVVYRFSDAALLLAAVAMHHLSGEGDFDRILGTGPWPMGHATIDVAAGLHRRAPHARGRGRQVGAGPVLGLAAPRHGRARRPPSAGLLRRPVGAPRGLPAPADQPDPRRVTAALRRSSWRWGWSPRVSPTWPAACRRTSSRRWPTRRSPRSRSSSSRSAWGSAMSPWSTCWATPACGRSSSSGRRRSCTTTTRWRTPSATICRRPRLPWVRPATGRAAGWMYRLALEQGYLDIILLEYVVRPFVRTFQWCDRLERRWTDFLVRRRIARVRPGQAPFRDDRRVFMNILQLPWLDYALADHADRLPVGEPAAGAASAPTIWGLAFTGTAMALARSWPGWGSTCASRSSPGLHLSPQYLPASAARSSPWTSSMHPWCRRWR